MRQWTVTPRWLVGLAGVARAMGLGGRGRGVADAEAGPMLEGLEARQLMAVNVLNPIADQTAPSNGSAIVLSLTSRYDDPNITGTVVRFATPLGNINVELFDQAVAGRRATPLTVANFLNYVDSGRYANTLFHRSVPGFVLQAGGFVVPGFPNVAPSNLTTFAAVQNEPGVSNVAGTIALAKQGGNPNSGTSQFFFNLGNNSSNLDVQNGGFTAFGRIVGNGLTVANQIAALSRVSDWEYFLGKGNDTFAYTIQPDPSQGVDPSLPIRNQNPAALNNVQPGDYVSAGITRTAELTYTVTSSNNGLVSAALSNNQLTLTPAVGQAGTATITVRATSVTGEFVEDVFLVAVGAAPTVSGLVLPGAAVTRPAGFQASVSSAGDPDGTVSRVEYYRDSNGNLTFDLGTDVLLGQGTSSANGYAATLSTSAMAGGPNRIFAVAVDDSGLRSAAVSATLNVVAPRPVVGGFTVSPQTVNRQGSFTLTTTGVLAGGGSISRVDFILDSNRNGTNDAADTKVAESLTAAGPGVFTANLAALNLPGGTLRFFAVAVDSTATSSVAKSAVGQVQTTTPTLDGLTIDNPTVSAGTNFVLRAVNPVGGSTIAKVLFYRDVNSNGTFESGTDTLAGEDASATDGYTFSFATTGLAAGAYRFLARVQDTDGQFSPARGAIGTIGARPVVTAVTAPASPVQRPAAALLTATGVSDADGTVARVNFYRDTNNNGQLDVGTDALLGFDDNSAGGWTLSIVTTGFPAGSVRVFAQAVDNGGLTSDAATTTFGIQNARPNAGPIVVTPNPYDRSTDITIRLPSPTDADGTIARAEFLLDTNKSGLLDEGDEALAVDEDAAGGWQVVGASAGMPSGQVRIFATVVDNDGFRSSPSTLVFTVTAPTPSAGTLTVSPATILPTGNFSLNLVGVSQTLGLTKAQFYRDTNGNNVFDVATDALIGEDTNAADGWGIQAAPGVTSGTVRFFARVQDNEDRWSPAVTATGSVGSVPTLTSVTASPTSVTRPGNVVLTVNGAAAVSGTLSLAEFYRDSNGNNTFDPGTDVLVGTDSTPGDGLSFTASTAGLTGSSVRYFARVQNSFGQQSAAATATVTLNNTRPTVAGLSRSAATVNRGQPLTLTAQNVADSDGTINRVEFFRDANRNGVLDASDTLLGQTTSGSGGAYGFSVTVSSLPLGANRFFAQAVDNEGGRSNGPSTVVTIANNPPTIASFLSDPSTGPRTGAFTLRALGVSDPGGTIQGVTFFRDSNGNGVFDAATDTSLGTGTLTSGEYRLTLAGSTLAVGSNRLFVRAQDNDGNFSNALQLLIVTT
jgi:cyclophilin family peptidyl-prolyl cis-trans isomerase